MRRCCPLICYKCVAAVAVLATWSQAFWRHGYQLFRLRRLDAAMDVQLGVRKAANRLKEAAKQRSSARIDAINSAVTARLGSARIDAINSAVTTRLAWAQERIVCLSPHIQEAVSEVTRGSPMLEKAVHMVTNELLQPVLEVLMPHVDSLNSLCSVKDDTDEDKSDDSNSSWLDRIPRPLVLHDLRQVAVWISHSAVLKVWYICLPTSCADLTQRLGGANNLRQLLTKTHIREVMAQQSKARRNKIQDMAQHPMFQKHHKIIAKAMRFAQLGCERLLGDRLAEHILGDCLKLESPTSEHTVRLHLDGPRYEGDARCADTNCDVTCMSERCEEQTQFRLIVKNSFIEIADENIPCSGMSRAASWSGPLCAPAAEPYIFTVTCSNVSQMVKSETTVLSSDCGEDSSVAPQDSEAPVVNASTDEPSTYDVSGPSRLDKDEAAAAAVSLPSADEPLELPTAVMLRSIPKEYSRSMLVDLLEKLGFGCKFCFVHVPVDFTHQVGLGYATIVLEDPHDAVDVRRCFDGFKDWGLPSNCIAEATWNEPRRSREQYVERYRNSPVMHASVPDEHKPALFEDGKRIPFPAPTKPIRRPRVRHAK